MMKMKSIINFKIILTIDKHSTWTMSMSMLSLRWQFTNKSVTGAPYSIRSYSLSHSWTLWWRVRWVLRMTLWRLDLRWQGISVVRLYEGGASIKYSKHGTVACQASSNAALSYFTPPPTTRRNSNSTAWTAALECMYPELAELKAS